ncbi:MAG: Asparagine--tRNA ligase [Planctomycetes bacterium ADurb.Bin412]|nr:MAG: Asparagine--tRNA ligase [Planctomycetes bacterium ADurb.Bin412]
MEANRIRISEMKNHVGQEVTVSGWLYNLRASGKVQFLIVRDGSGYCQGVFEKKEDSADRFEQVKHLGQESSLTVTGTVRQEPRSIGGYELAVADVRIVQNTQGYPITPKEHGIEFLLRNRHLHLRSRRQWALARIRHTVVEAIRGFFNSHGFTLVDTPIFAPAAGEGEQTLFAVDYFGEPVYLAQTGQLYLESAALSLGKVYCFGPTFRAEKSKTRRHLTEFWMVEPEITYIDLNDLMGVAEDFICAIVQAVLATNREELEFLERNLAELEQIQKPFVRLSYTDAVELLHSEKVKNYLEEQLTAKQNLLKETEANINQWTAEQETAAKQWQKDKLAAQIIKARELASELSEQISNIPQHMELAAGFRWGKDLGGSDETIIASLHDRPIFVHRYPKAAKAFYMKPDPENGQVVLNFDCLAPQGYGEIIGGSMREDSYEALVSRIQEEGYNQADYEWYLDLRRYGSVPHGGFGLGVERTVAWLAGLKHIRETIAFPRMMGKIYP